MKYLLIFCFACSPLTNVNTYMVIEKVQRTGDPSRMYKISGTIHCDSLFTNTVCLPGDTVYLTKVKIQ